MNRLPYKKGDPVPQLDFSIFEREDLTHLKEGNYLFTSNEGIATQIENRFLHFPLEEEFNILYFTVVEE